MKARLSTKMVGETLEQHCETEFNRIRATAFPRAYFEKDNDARTGSKGDYIFRDSDEAGTEIVSIMFEMKNESDRTATKNRNEDFLKELDKDRTEKGCEYAVLVSLLEPDSELYNTGIVDVFHRYPKMYVVRPAVLHPDHHAAAQCGDELAQVQVGAGAREGAEHRHHELRERARDVQDAFAKNYDLPPGGSRRRSRRSTSRSTTCRRPRTPCSAPTEPSSCERQGAGRDDQEADARQPDDGGQVCRMHPHRQTKLLRIDAGNPFQYGLVNTDRQGTALLKYWKRRSQ
jgi:hypothetical protein